jgi:hypothetical protein
MKNKIQTSVALPLLVAFNMLCATPAISCEGDLLLKCNFETGSIAVCFRHAEISVEIKDTNAAEARYFSSIDNADLQPWTGLGRYRTTLLRLEDGRNRIDVFSTFDTRGGDGFWHAGFNTYKSGTFVAQTICPNSQSSDWLDPIDAAKTARGWCWDLEAEHWTRTCA